MGAVVVVCIHFFQHDMSVSCQCEKKSRSDSENISKQLKPYQMLDMFFLLYRFMVYKFFNAFPVDFAERVPVVDVVVSDILRTFVSD